MNIDLDIANWERVKNFDHSLRIITDPTTTDVLTIEPGACGPRVAWAHERGTVIVPNEVLDIMHGSPLWDAARQALREERDKYDRERKQNDERSLDCTPMY